MKKKVIKKIIILLVFVFLFAITIFWLIQDKKEEKTEKEAFVLMGSECGFDYLACCDNNPICSFGQECCVDPNNFDRNYCADECTCGAQDEFCCEGNICDNGLICDSGNCNTCGEEGDICCLGEEACLSNLACVAGECIACGGTGEICCQGENECRDLESGRSECMKGICNFCGFSGNRACVTGDKCLLGHLLNNNICHECGDINEPCCNEESGLAYDCDPNKNLICDLGFCKNK